MRARTARRNVRTAITTGRASSSRCSTPRAASAPLANRALARGVVIDALDLDLREVQGHAPQPAVQGHGPAGLKFVGQRGVVARCEAALVIAHHGAYLAI